MDKVVYNRIFVYWCFRQQKGHAVKRDLCFACLIDITMRCYKQRRYQRIVCYCRR